MSLSIGIDVGGTKIAAGVVDAEGKVLEELRVESPANSTEAIGKTIEDLVARLREGRDIEALGVGAAGFIDARRATVMFAPNLAWRDVDLKSELERRTGLPVVVENDANAAAWGEFRFGAGEDVDDLLLMTVGTGVGGGIVLGGSLQRGGHGVAAEVGHLRMVPDGLPCPCGAHGCLEQYASGSALVRETRAAAETDPDGANALLALAGSVEKISGPMVTEAALGGDPFAQARLADLGTWLGAGIASLCAVLDPSVVVIGGGVSAAGDLLLDPARSAYLDGLTGRGYRPEADLRLAQLGNTAGLIGAADLARR